MNIHELLLSGDLKVAALPPANTQDLSADFLTLPLIAEDYPARTASMWNAAYKAFDMRDRNVMVVANPDQANHLLAVLRKDDQYRGGGAGVGFKEAVVPHLDEITPLASAMGAVNILKKDARGRLIGDNTDGLGYVQSLEEALNQQGVAIEGSHVLMLGAGGTGRAIAFALGERGAQVTILNRTPARAEELAESVNAHFGKEVAIGSGRELIPDAILVADAVVSVIDDAHSPLDVYSTLGDMQLPITPESIEANCKSAEAVLQYAKPSLVVSDIRIRSAETPMLTQAREHGFAVLDGIPMVINQGVAAFWWLYGEQLAKQDITQEDVERIMRTAAGW